MSTSSSLDYDHGETKYWSKWFLAQMLSMIELISTQCSIGKSLPQVYKDFKNHLISKKFHKLMSRNKIGLMLSISLLEGILLGICVLGPSPALRSDYYRYLREREMLIFWDKQCTYKSSNYFLSFASISSSCRILAS